MTLARRRTPEQASRAAVLYFYCGFTAAPPRSRAPYRPDAGRPACQRRAPGLAVQDDDGDGDHGPVLEAGQRERQRLERDLHDGAQQRLIGLSLRLGILESQLRADPAAQQALADAKQEVATSLAELRDIARGLYPAVLTGHGLAVALESVVAQATVPVRLEIRLHERLPEPIEVAAFYVVRESLTNVSRHAQATSASVEIDRSGETVVVEIADNGVGGADTALGTGLRGLADRVESLSGTLRVWSPAGGGTRVRAELPCG